MNDEVEDLRRRLAESEARVAALTERNADGMVIVDDDGTVRFANPAACALFGKPEPALVGHPFGFPLVTREVTTIDVLGEARRHAVAEMRVAEITWEDRTAYLASLRDVTERMRADELLRHKEEQLLRAQRLMAVGRFAAEMAHQMNDVLMGVAGLSRVALLKLGAYSPASRLISEILKATDEGAVVVRRLALLAAHRAAHPRALDVNALVDGLAPLLRRLAGRPFEVSIDLGPALWPAHADDAHVEQILVNLLITARESMPNGGAIAVRTRNVTLGPAEDPFRDPVEAGEYVLLEVEARGGDVHEQHFEPLFTSPGDAGAGPGLWVVRSFIEESGGQLKIRGNAGFLVYLPRAPRAATELDAPSAARVGAGETILVVDDEPLIRIALRSALEHAGFEVLDAESAAEATRVASSFGGAIHALVADVRMPDESGLALGRRLAAVRPNLRVVYMADWGEGASLRERVGDAELLEKPFALDVLLTLLRRILDASTAGARAPQPGPRGAVVLLVEDEDTTRVALSRLLTFRGHVVHAAKDADAALALARKVGAIDVLVTDLALPESSSNGADLARTLIEMIPNAKVIFVSGFPRDIASQRYRLPDGAHYLEKPLELDVLEQHLEDLRASA